MIRGMMMYSRLSFAVILWANRSCIKHRRSLARDAPSVKFLYFCFCIILFIFFFVFCSLCTLFFIYPRVRRNAWETIRIENSKRELAKMFVPGKFPVGVVGKVNTESIYLSFSLPFSFVHRRQLSSFPSLRFAREVTREMSHWIRTGSLHHHPLPLYPL